MADVAKGRVLRKVTNGDGTPYGFRFDCPGCKEPHVIPTYGPKAWGFDGNEESPTFTPSILITRKGIDYPTADHPGTPVIEICHSFIRAGRWEFLGDCTHKLAGQTVPMIEIKEEVVSGG